MLAKKKKKERKEDESAMLFVRFSSPTPSFIVYHLATNYSFDFFAFATFLTTDTER